MIKKVIVGLALVLALVGCEDLNYKSGNIDNSVNNSVNDSVVNYSAEQEQILAEGYTPDEFGVCETGFFWCSIESKCLPAVDGASCSLDHTDEEEAEAAEIADNARL